MRKRKLSYRSIKQGNRILNTQIYSEILMYLDELEIKKTRPEDRKFIYFHNRRQRVFNSFPKERMKRKKSKLLERRQLNLKLNLSNVKLNVTNLKLNFENNKDYNIQMEK